MKKVLFILFILPLGIFAQPLTTYTVAINISRSVALHSEAKSLGECANENEVSDTKADFGYYLTTQKMVGREVSGVFEMSSQKFATQNEPFQGNTSFLVTGSGHTESHYPCADDCKSKTVTTSLSGSGQTALNVFPFVFQYNKQTKLGNVTIEPMFNCVGKSQEKTVGCNPENINEDASGEIMAMSGYGAINLSNEYKKGQIFTPSPNLNMPQGYEKMVPNLEELKKQHPEMFQNVDMQLTESLMDKGFGAATITEMPTGYTISFALTKTIDVTPKDANSEGHTEKKTITFNTNVNITIGGELNKYQAFLIPTDKNAYDNFLPRGRSVENTNPNVGGNKLVFRVKIIDAAGKEVTNTKSFTTTYTLTSTSKYAGICMNFPLQSDDDSPDFRWDSAMYQMKNAGKIATISQEEVVSKTGGGNQIVAIVQSMDYAAFTRLKATVYLEDEKLTLTAVNEAFPTQKYLSIPKDIDENKIADKWEQDANVYGKLENYDDDLPDRQKRRGDGYTLWEEYRGFKCEEDALKESSHNVRMGKHVRTDPNYKDCFVHDADGLFKRYYEPLNPADLNWHYITTQEMVFTQKGGDPNNRWVNSNSAHPYFYARQYAIYVRDGLTSGGTIAGSSWNRPDPGILKSYKGLSEDEETIIKCYLKNDEPFSPKSMYSCEIYTKTLEDYTKGIGVFTFAPAAPPCGFQQFYDIQMRITVLHEVGHCIGIYHHSPSDCEGVRDCIMRYGTKDETLLKTCTPQYRYCTHSDTYQQANKIPENADPNSTYPIKMEAKSAHDCYGQIDIKSDP